MSKFNSSNTFPGDRISLWRSGPVHLVVKTHDTFVVCLGTDAHIRYTQIAGNASYDIRYTHFMKCINILQKL